MQAGRRQKNAKVTDFYYMSFRIQTKMLPTLRPYDRRFLH